MSEIELITSGDKLFEEIWDLIDNSKTCCWILTYHMANSFIANETLRKLAKAAERGVDVVLYVDWLNYYLDDNLAKILISKGGKIEALNPMSLITRYAMGLDVFPRHIFERYHQKILIADENIIIGSANYDVEYGGKIYGNDQFYDLNVKLKNKCLDDAKQIFFTIADRFNYKLKDHKLCEFEDDNVELLSTEPYYLKWSIQEKILEMIDRAKHRVIIVNGYYFDLKKITKAIERARNRGVDVDFFTSKTRDQPVYNKLKNYKLTKSLRKHGVKVFEYPKRILHMKAYITDDEFMLGSFNSDRWSWSMNNELNLYCNDKNTTDKIMNIINDAKQYYKPVKKYPPLVSKFLVKFWHNFLYASEIVMNTKKDLKGFIPLMYISDQSDPIVNRYSRKQSKIESLTISTFTLNYFGTQ